ncbi:MAG: hypothetical protein BGO12_04450 [Verrucomicrobia bacterium 61-8]|nr:MAG: hypothetical protein BGO12_04450 [Verrucomicrobia bacterium 61-8]
MSLTSAYVYEPPTVLNIEDMPQSLQSLRRSLTKMIFTAEAFFAKYSDDHVVLVTLTFPVPVIAAKTASKMLDKLLKRFKRRWPSFLWVRERSSNRAIHFHVLLPTFFNARRGVALEKFRTLRKEDRERKRQLVNPDTLKLWDEIERMARDVGFGRCEVAPIYESGVAVTNYLGKTVSQSWDLGFWKEEKHCRWWTASRNLKCCTDKFCVNSKFLRQLLASFAEALGAPGLAALLSLCGPRYAYYAWRWFQSGRPAISRSNRESYVRRVPKQVIRRRPKASLADIPSGDGEASLRGLSPKTKPSSREGAPTTTFSPER